MISSLGLLKTPVGGTVNRPYEQHFCLTVALPNFKIRCVGTNSYRMTCASVGSATFMQMSFCVAFLQLVDGHLISKFQPSRWSGALRAAPDRCGFQSDMRGLSFKIVLHGLPWVLLSQLGLVAKRGEGRRDRVHSL